MSGPSQLCSHPLLSGSQDELCSQFLNLNRQILTGKRLELDWHQTLPSPGGEKPWAEQDGPSSSALQLHHSFWQMLKDWGFLTLVQGSSSTLEMPLTCTHKLKPSSLWDKVQAALTLQPCKLKQRGRSRQRLKWDYFLMCATTTTHHNYPRGNYKKLGTTEDEALSFPRWAVSTRKL